MRYIAGINASRSAPARVTIAAKPNPSYGTEVHVDFGGMSAWFSEAEATALGRDLIEAGIRIRDEEGSR